MAFELYLMGHGIYRPRNQYVKLPDNYTIVFYTNHGQRLPESQIQPILRDKAYPVETYLPGSSMPNYTWINGEQQNWNFYVLGEGPDMRMRPNLSNNIGKNMHLKLDRRSKDWDARYVQFFKNLAGMRLDEEFTLKMLWQKDGAKKYFEDKTVPITIHALLCREIVIN